MNMDQALVPVMVLTSGGNGGKPTLTASTSVRNSPATEPLTDEMVNAILAGRGLRGWLRAARVARVLGLFTLYIFLDTYDIRAEFDLSLIHI